MDNWIFTLHFEGSQEQADQLLDQLLEYADGVEGLNVIGFAAQELDEGEDDGEGEESE